MRDKTTQDKTPMPPKAVEGGAAKAFESTPIVTSGIDVTPPAGSNLKDWALYYGNVGWNVLPLLPDTYEDPAADYREATTDPKQISAWWKENPNYNIGIVAKRFFRVKGEGIDHPYTVFMLSDDAETDSGSINKGLDGVRYGIVCVPPSIAYGWPRVWSKLNQKQISIHQNKGREVV